MANELASGGATTLSIQPLTKTPAVLQTGIFTYENLGVSNPNGTRLLDPNNQPLRASRIRVYCPRVSWHFDTDASSLITTPSGNGVTSDGRFNYPGTPEYCLVIFQSNGFREAITGTSPADAQVFQVFNGADILTNVNDENNAPNDYPDNSGAYDLVLEIVSP
jgi:hypothetical protein